jgi:hypothetical protein
VRQTPEVELFEVHAEAPVGLGRPVCGLRKGGGSRAGILFGSAPRDNPRGVPRRAPLRYNGGRNPQS